jgi:hypothetical protein
MASWNLDVWDIQRLKGIALYNWDKETKIKTIDALASYRKNALSALTDIASLVLDKEIKEYTLDKIKQINEGTT